VKHKLNDPLLKEEDLNSLADQYIDTCIKGKFGIGGPFNIVAYNFSKCLLNAWVKNFG